MHMHRIVAVIFIVVVVLPASMLLAFYFVSFVPHLSELKQLSNQGLKSISSIEEDFYSLAVASETKSGIRTWAVQQSYVTMVMSDRKKSMLSWHANNALWRAVSYLHFNDRQIFGVWVQCAIVNCDSSLNHSSLHYFGKDLGFLNVTEQAQIIASVAKPRMFKLGSELGMARANKIIQKLETQQTTGINK